MRLTSCVDARHRGGSACAALDRRPLDTPLRKGVHAIYSHACRTLTRRTTHCLQSECVQDTIVRFCDAFLHCSNTHVNNGIMREVRNFSSSPTHRKRAKQQNRTTCHASHKRGLRSPGQQSASPHQPASCHPSQPSQHCISHAHFTSRDL